MKFKIMTAEERAEIIRKRELRNESGLKLIPSTYIDFNVLDSVEDELIVLDDFIPPAISQFIDQEKRENFLKDLDNLYVHLRTKSHALSDSLMEKYDDDKTFWAVDVIEFLENNPQFMNLFKPIFFEHFYCPKLNYDNYTKTDE